MPGAGLAIVAGRGDAAAAPRRGLRRAAAGPTASWSSTGVALDWLAGHPVLRRRFEKPGRLFADLRAAGCGEVTFAGGIARPQLRPLRFDLKMLRLAPRLLRGIRSGDDATLRLVAGIFEAEGFEVRAPHEILTDLRRAAGRARPGRAGGRDRADAARAAAIVAALGAADVGQGAVVAGGICLGLESIQGTDALLDFVARTAGRVRPAGARGVLFKAPKPGQDRRVDLPAIGPGTLERAAAAGLAGVAVEAGGVMILGFAATVAAADAAGLFLWAREAGP